MTAVDITGSPGDLFEDTAFTSPSHLNPGLYLSDPQGHALLVGTNQRSLTVLDFGNSLVEVAGVVVQSPEVLERTANRLLWLAGRMRERSGVTA